MKELEQIPREAERSSGMWGFVWEVIQFVALTIVIVVPIRVYVAQPYIVSGNSMYPTFESGDYLIVDQLSYRLNEPTYGDVVIFRYPQDPSKFFIKRIIGKPNDVIEFVNGALTIVNTEHPDGIAFDDPYANLLSRETKTVTLKEKEYYVLGDNRIASLDSRAWGPLPENLITGRVLARLFPVSHIDLLPGKIQFFKMPSNSN